MADILLIEPDRILTRIYCAYLRERGHIVTAAFGAQAAVQELDMHKPDVVVLEMQLAGHNGIEFLYELRSYPDWQDIPVVLHTMVLLESLKLSADLLRAMGVTQYLYKPATLLHHLEEVVNEVVVPRNSYNARGLVKPRLVEHTDALRPAQT